MPKTYEELSGGMGRKILFRPERYHAGSLFRDVHPVVQIDAVHYDVRDLSMNGLLFVAADEGRPFEIGQEIPFRLMIGEALGHQGTATVTRLEPHGSGSKIGLQVVDGFINIPVLLVLHENIALEMLLADGVQSEIDRVPAEYRKVCSDAVFLLRRTREVMDRNYKREKARTSLMPGDPATDLFEARCESQFFDSWNEIRARANAIVQPLMSDPKVTSAIKQFTETILTPELVVAPNWKRAYEKPLGYPGDFELMKYFYSGERHGDTPFARFLHHVGNAHPIPSSIPKRMNEIKKAIARTVSTTQTDGRPVRITSLGAGPAREVREYLRQGNPDRAVHFCLVDQDEQALAYAYSQCFPLKTMYGDRVELECKFASFGQMLRNPKLLRELDGQDLIYSAGLFDYLHTKIAQNLIRALYSCLNKGGSLIVGNLKSPNDGIWTPEFLSDWTMIYRTKEDMELLASAVDAPFELKTEPSGYTYLLTLTR